MTVENTIKRYKEFVATGQEFNAASLKVHMLNSKKYQDSPEFKALFAPVEKEKEKEKKKKKNGKKSKR